MEQSSLLGNVPRPPEPIASPSAENPSRPANCCSNKAKIFLVVFAVTFVAAISSISAYFFAKSRVQTPVTSPTPIAQASPTLDETANWKTYISSDMHFEIKHPDIVQVNSGIVNKQNTINISYKGKYQGNNMGWVDGITISITFNPINPPVSEAIKKIINDEEKHFPDTFKPAQNVKIDGVNGYQVGRILDNGTSDIYLPYNESAYLLINLSVMDSYNLGYQKIADQILSTFKFLE